MWNLKESACILTGTQPGTLTIAAEKVYLKMKADRDKGGSSLIQYSFNDKKGYYQNSNVDFP